MPLPRLQHLVTASLASESKWKDKPKTNRQWVSQEQKEVKTEVTMLTDSWQEYLTASINELHTSWIINDIATYLNTYHLVPWLQNWEKIEIPISSHEFFETVKEPCWSTTYNDLLANYLNWGIQGCLHFRSVSQIETVLAEWAKREWMLFTLERDDWKRQTKSWFLQNRSINKATSLDTPPHE